jgi:hypothetical protein
LPVALPYVRYDYMFDQPIFGGEVGFKSSVYSLTRDEAVIAFPSVDLGTDQQRGSLEFNWQRQMYTDMGQVITPFATLRGDLYYSKNIPDPNIPGLYIDGETTGRSSETTIYAVVNPESIIAARVSRSARGVAGLRPGFDGGRPNRRAARRNVAAEQPASVAICSSGMPESISATSAARSFKFGSGCDRPPSTVVTVQRSSSRERRLHTQPLRTRQNERRASIMRCEGGRCPASVLHRGPTSFVAATAILRIRSSATVRRGYLRSTPMRLIASSCGSFRSRFRVKNV